ncbi:MAG TPA: DNA-3-methyladenine glycosylase [Candidatus Limnocylindrales bacterium]|nr:DNA-3-methyladenine glycosylase [Candidatus Limnocylindrales bacterium]
MAVSASRSAAEPARRSPLERQFYAVTADELASRLLGMVVVSTIGGLTCRGRIVETEAYLGPDDRASHARAGRTNRTGPMFGPPGHAYVYLIYGLHQCLNVVADREGTAGAVLLRALEPLEGEDVMRRRRGRVHDPASRLCAGPARLCQAMAVTRTFSGHDLTAGEQLWLERPAADTGQRAPAARQVASGPRIGVAYAAEPWASAPLRFWLHDSPAISR